MGDKSSSPPAAVAVDDNVLTSEEEAAVRDLRTRIEESKKRGIDVAAKYTNFELAKFIIVAKCNVEKAYKRFKNFHKLRLKHKFDELSEEDVLKSARKAGAFIGLGGRDKQGRAIVCMDTGALDPDKFDAGPLMLAFVKMFEKVNADIASTRRGIIFCASMHNFGWKNFSLKLEKEFSGLYQEGYPVRMAGMFMVDPPWWINMVMKIARTFLKKKLMDRIQLVTDQGDPATTENHLYRICPPAQLHACVKGSLTDSLEETVKKIIASQSNTAAAK